MPKVPLCLQCNKPVIEDRHDYIDVNEDDPYGRTMWVHLDCYDAYQAEAEGASPRQEAR